VLLLIVAIYLRPFPADDRAIGIIEMSSQPGSLGLRGGILVRTTASHLLMSPADTGDAPIGTGLVFYPGARVDPRAYATLLAPVVEAGHPVVVVKPPLGFALLDINAATGAVKAFDAWSEVDGRPDRWAVGGHSLGGVAASDYAGEVAISDIGGPASDVAGLVLWAAYPARSLADADLPVLSVSGTSDALTTPAEIEQSKDLLPPGTDFVVIEGANHAQFGDYGDQGGDGEATISDEEARTRIVEATMLFLDRLDEPGSG
jgi:pimeloyl-ACP methyl ester carboxylesterase